MRSQKLLLLLVMLGMFFSINAQTFPQRGSVDYWESLRVAYQTKIDWIQSNPTENAAAIESGWYEMANANVQQATQNKHLAEQSSNQIYMPQTMRSINAEPEPGGGLCEEAAPFCTDYDYDFPCGTNESPGESGPDYGCLGSQPNPAWYFMEIETSGDIVMALTAPADIDFIIWGPFTEVTCDYAQLSEANIVDCSFSGTNEEDPEIGPGSSGGPTTATADEFYIFLITNYSNNTQDFSITQTDGDGATDCTGLTCVLVNESLTVNVGECEPHQEPVGNYYSEYDISGTIEINPAPPTQTNDSLAFFVDGVWYMSLTAPLSSPSAYVMNNLLADGNTHTITSTLYFSDEDGQDFCYQTIDYTSPANCAVCAAVAGPDITECGEDIFMQGSVSTGDVNTAWTTDCSTITFADINSSSSQITYTGNYIAGAPVSCDLIWTITNNLGLSCWDTTTVTFQPIPDSDFTLTTDACDGTTVDASLINIANIPIAAYTWNYSSATEQTGTEDANITLLYENAVGQNQICLIVTSDLGCVSTNHCEQTLIKPIPSCDFSVLAPICSGGTTMLTYDNNNTPEMNCPSLADFTLDPAITATATGNLCAWEISAINNTNSIVSYPISFQYTIDGCTSEICTSSLQVQYQGAEADGLQCCADPTPNPGTSVSVCSLEHVLDAQYTGGGNWGFWEQVSGPAVTFLPISAQGDANNPGNANAHIRVDVPGVV